MRNQLLHITGFPLALGLAALCLPAAAADREHKAHEHGKGTLNIAIDEGEIELELIAPGADIVGFEHQPSTEEHHAAIDAAVEKLEQGLALFVFPTGAGCLLEEVEIESELVEHDDDHPGHGHGKDEHAHGEHKDDHAEHKDGHAHDGHGHGEHAEGEHDEEHAEFHVHYHFECENTAAVTEIALTYFEQFPNAEVLDVQAITASGQRAMRLTAEASALVF